MKAEDFYHVGSLRERAAFNKGAFLSDARFIRSIRAAKLRYGVSFLCEARQYGLFADTFFPAGHRLLYIGKATLTTTDVISLLDLPSSPIDDYSSTPPVRHYNEFFYAGSKAFPGERTASLSQVKVMLTECVELPKKRGRGSGVRSKTTVEEIAWIDLARINSPLLMVNPGSSTAYPNIDVVTIGEGVDKEYFLEAARDIRRGEELLLWYH
jgi:hypothetical protein